MTRLENILSLAPVGRVVVIFFIILTLPFLFLPLVIVVAVVVETVAWIVWDDDERPHLDLTPAAAQIP